jgi:hypothetical protein
MRTTSENMDGVERHSAARHRGDCQHQQGFFSHYVVCALGLFWCKNLLV